MELSQRFIRAIELPRPERDTKSDLWLSNDDLKPIPKEKRTWGSLTCTCYITVA